MTDEQDPRYPVPPLLQTIKERWEGIGAKVTIKPELPWHPLHDPGCWEIKVVLDQVTVQQRVVSHVLKYARSEDSIFDHLNRYIESGLAKHLLAPGSTTFRRLLREKDVTTIKAAHAALVDSFGKVGLCWACGERPSKYHGRCEAANLVRLLDRLDATKKGDPK